jgi:hypothetical protein
VKAGPSHTTTPTTIRKDQQLVQQVTQKNQNNPQNGPARFLRTQQRASTIHSTPSTFHTHPKQEQAVLASAIPLHV